MHHLGHGREIADFAVFYNESRTHASLAGKPPGGDPDNVASLKQYGWRAHCRRITSYNVCYTKLLRDAEGVVLVNFPFACCFFTGGVYRGNLSVII